MLEEAEERDQLNREYFAMKALYDAKVPKKTDCCVHQQIYSHNISTVGHTGIHAWGNRVRRRFFGGGATVDEPRIPCL